MIRRWAALALLLAVVALSLLAAPRGHVPPPAAAVAVVVPLAVVALAVGRDRDRAERLVAFPATRPAVTAGAVMTWYSTVRARRGDGRGVRAHARGRRAPSPA